MDEVLSMAAAIAGKLNQSGAYQDYLSAKRAIDTQPELKRELAQYKKTHFDYQYRRMNNEQPAFEEEKAVSALFWQLMRNEDAKKYLENERQMVELLDKIYHMIGGACPLDLYMPDA